MEWPKRRLDDTSQFWLGLKRVSPSVPISHRSRSARRAYGIKFTPEITVAQKAALYLADVALLVSAACRDPIDGDVGSQWLSLCLMLLHTAGRS